MAIPGPKPQPPKIKLLKGNPGKRPIPLAPEAKPVVSTRCPRGLPKAAQREWRRVAPELARLGLLTELDRAALADYCLCVARLEECEADIAERGPLVEGDRGLVKNPACQLGREYRHQMMRWAAEFGLTPSSRGRMTLPETETEDELESLLGGCRSASG